LTTAVLLYIADGELSVTWVRAVECEFVVEMNQELARALGDPTRYSIADFIAKSNHPVTIAELTEFVGLNHNAVRQHLTRLKRVGIVLEAIEGRSLPGRPRLLYRINSDRLSRFGLPGPYEYLAKILADSASNGLPVKDEGRNQGIREAREANNAEVPGRKAERFSPLDALESSLVTRGFDPKRSDSGALGELILKSCPFAEVAQSYPDVICNLHHGLLEGVYSGHGGEGVVDLIPKDPRLAGCVLSVIQELGGSET
jgi:predicted ArsR family transcriptional regulator